VVAICARAPMFVCICMCYSYKTVVCFEVCIRNVENIKYKVIRPNLPLVMCKA